MCPRAAPTLLSRLTNTQNGSLRAPPPIAARCFSSPQNKQYLYVHDSNSGRPRDGLSRKKLYPSVTNLGCPHRMCFTTERPRLIVKSVTKLFVQISYQNHLCNHSTTLYKLDKNVLRLRTVKHCTV
jgi:hypothetical protein